MSRKGGPGNPWPSKCIKLRRGGIVGNLEADCRIRREGERGRCDLDSNVNWLDWMSSSCAEN